MGELDGEATGTRGELAVCGVCNCGGEPGNVDESDETEVERCLQWWVVIGIG